MAEHSEFIEQLRREIEAYCKYKDLLVVEDEHLREAIKEIMWDEYLHAKFLRRYLMREGVYTPEEYADIEKRYRRIESDM